MIVWCLNKELYNNRMKRDSSKCGPSSDGGGAEKTTSTHPQHVVLLNAWNQIKMLLWRNTHPFTHAHTNTNTDLRLYAYCLREDKVQWFHSASYFPIYSWKVSQDSLQRSVLSADGSLKGRMDVLSRQGHQTDDERWEWWWQEKERDREKIAGVTASTCSPQLSDRQAPEREG